MRLLHLLHLLRLLRLLCLLCLLCLLRLFTASFQVYRPGTDTVLDTCCLERPPGSTLFGSGCTDVTLAATLEDIEMVFLVLYTMEMTVKMVALGLWSDKMGYFRNGWNVMDSVVVFTGWISAFSGQASLGALRAFRVLRPLRAMTTAPGMRAVRLAVSFIFSILVA